MYSERVLGSVGFQFEEHRNHHRAMNVMRRAAQNVLQADRNIGDHAVHGIALVQARIAAFEVVSSCEN